MLPEINVFPYIMQASRLSPAVLHGSTPPDPSPGEHPSRLSEARGKQENTHRHESSLRSLRSYPRPDVILASTSAIARWTAAVIRSEEHTSELQSLMRISSAVFCLKKTISKTMTIPPHHNAQETP